MELYAGVGAAGAAGVARAEHELMLAPVAVAHPDSPRLPARPAGEGHHLADPQAGPQDRGEQVRQPVRQHRLQGGAGHARPNPNRRWATRRICISSEPSVMRYRRW